MLATPKIVPLPADDKHHGGPWDGARAIVLHHTGGTDSRAWLTRTSNPPVSVHVLIQKDGTIYRIVPDNEQAWHVGRSNLGNWTTASGDKGSASEICLGIEIENLGNGTDPYPEAQRNSVAWQIRQWWDKYGDLPVITHELIDTQGKNDPAGLDLRDILRRALDAQKETTSTLFRGPVLTFAPSVARLRQSIVAGGYTALKVVTAWGGIQWTDTTRAQTAALCEQLIVRTAEGDPSHGKPYPHAEQIIQEIDPWEHWRPGLWVEIGNEPNHPGYAVDPSGYGWQLKHAIQQIRTHFRRAKIIAPALMVKEGDAAAWLKDENFRAALRSCDAIGVHAYAHHQFDDAGFLKEIDRLYKDFRDLPWVLTEFGINDPKTTDAVKGERYARLTLPSPYIGALHYHIDLAAQAGTDAANYALDLTGDVAYGNVV